MLADSLLLPECTYRPGSFAGLMVLYESNFLKLSRLIDLQDVGESKRISRVRGDNDLYLECIRREPYTTTARLTYWLDDAAGMPMMDPDMTIRIYHDASLAEAVSCRLRHQHRMIRELARSHAGELNRRWQINMMLNKWLDYVLDCGHGFA
jgi:uncharacterized protein YqiB (DUF1249 family)